MKIFKVRRFLQITSTLFHNGYLGFLSTKGIYTGFLKSFCAPGLNCYSCPAALFSCPLGALQQVMISLRLLPFELLSKAFFYIFGQVLLFSLLFGRFICGWLCPFGLLQEVIYKIPFYKKQITLPFQIQRYLKHFFLLFFVFLFPALFLKEEIGYGLLWFCKFVCPAGTLEAGYLNLLINPSLKEKVGLIFLLKTIILIGVIIFCLMEIRFFCKNLCPLGLIYGLFNKFSLLKLRWDEGACSICGVCEKVCPMNLKIPKEINSTECIRCLNCLELCPKKAIHLEKNLWYLPERYLITKSVGELKNERRWKGTR